MAAFSFDALVATAASWTSPEFEGRETKFDDLVHAGSIHNRLRAFDWAREEIAPAESTGSRVGNQARGSARKESVQRGASPFTGNASGSSALPDVIAATLVQPPSQAFGSDPSVWNLYPYVGSNPLVRTDPDGRSGTVVGGIVGGLAGGLWELGRQAIAGEDINWRKVAGSAARGAVVGVAVGSVVDTGGASLPVLMGTGVLSNVAGGELGRRISGEETTFRAVASDVAGGLALGGGAVGGVVASRLAAGVSSKFVQGAVIGSAAGFGASTTEVAVGRASSGLTGSKYKGSAVDDLKKIAITTGAGALAGGLIGAAIEARQAVRAWRAANTEAEIIGGKVRPYNEARAARIPGYDNHHLDPPLGRNDPGYSTGPTIPVRNDNAGGRVAGGQNWHTGQGGFQTSLNEHISELGYTREQWNNLATETRQLLLRRYYASFGIPFPVKK